MSIKYVICIIVNFHVFHGYHIGEKRLFSFLENVLIECCNQLFPCQYNEFKWFRSVIEFNGVSIPLYPRGTFEHMFWCSWAVAIFLKYEYMHWLTKDRHVFVVNLILCQLITNCLFRNVYIGEFYWIPSPASNHGSHSDRNFINSDENYRNKTPCTPLIYPGESYEISLS